MQRNHVKHKITKVLIANRAEIALRIRRTLDRLGIGSVQLVAPADRQLSFARSAAECAEVVGPRPVDSYLNVDEIVATAKKLGCDAVHPGYGFLSENALLPEALSAGGITFIGPSAEAMRLLGSKAAARELAQKLKIPVSRGSAPNLTDEELYKEAARVGFPLLIKAVAGGGGRGMRRVSELEALLPSLKLARAEALKFFKDSNVYLERQVIGPRHVEVQFCGDGLGHAIHLGTRDCSMQRRNQKVLEEAPAPGLSKKLRSKLHSAACKLAIAARYRGVGTCEFLVAGEDYYFLEVNTRLQVEHPVTEFITGLDLVELQIQVAQGQRLPAQKSIRFKGHAFEFRVNAERALEGFAPENGKISELTPSPFPHRADFGYSVGDEISPHFDSLIGKVIHGAPTRRQALEEMRDILATYKLNGVRTSLDLGPWLLETGACSVRNIEIGFIERELTPHVCRELRARLCKDPAFITTEVVSQTGVPVMVSEYRYRSNKYKCTYTIEIQHSRDGNFVAVPVIDGRRARNKFCRRSNGLSTVLKSLIEDVLEKTSPTEVLQGA